MVPEDEPIEEAVEPDSKGKILCGWCPKNIRFDKDKHKRKERKKRREFLDRGYYECSSCSRGSIDEMTARNHVAMHFSKRRFKNDWGETQFTDRPKDFAIICGDQEKRKYGSKLLLLLLYYCFSIFYSCFKFDFINDR